jgi:hypothetical protein
MSAAMAARQLSQALGSRGRSGESSGEAGPGERREPARGEERARVGVAARDLKPQRTLDQVIVAGWHELLAGRTATCPLCGGKLEPRYASHASPVGGRCAACGTTLE